MNPLTTEKPDSFFFKWDNFDKVLSFNFHSYFTRNLFTDVVLITELKFISAHKIVLSGEFVNDS
jgi:hypothetical protein